jgi:hypothetical protein
MKPTKGGKKKQEKDAKKKSYEKPRIMVKSSVPHTPAAWGSYQPQS